MGIKPIQMVVRSRVIRAHTYERRSVSRAPLAIENLHGKSKQSQTTSFIQPNVHCFPTQTSEKY